MGEVVEVKNLCWTWDGSPPYVSIPSGDWNRSLPVDPAPCYPNDKGIVETTLALCEKAFPLPVPVPVFLLSFEGLGRSNGHTEHGHDYRWVDDHDRYKGAPHIVLFGKRVPVHPGMTKYLVAHEYGHVVDHFIAHRRYAGQSPWADMRKAYSEMRGLKTEIAYYGPGTWHLSPGEVLANDFRILVAGVEPEYWPHPGIAHPLDCPEAKAFWEEAVKENQAPYPEWKPKKN